MFIHVVCFIFAVTTWITVITAVTVHPIGWEICSERMCCVGMIYLQVLVVGLMASTVVTVLADFYIFKIVANRMESFAKGGSSKVDTKATCSSAFAHPGIQLTLNSNTIYFFLF